MGGARSKKRCKKKKGSQKYLFERALGVFRRRISDCGWGWEKGKYGVVKRMIKSYGVVRRLVSDYD